MSESFGRQLVGLSPAEVLSLERAAGRDGIWSRLDACNGRLIQASLAGERIVTVDMQQPAHPVELVGLSEDDRLHIRHSFLLTNQQSCGAWFLPERVNVDLAAANLPHHFRAQRPPREQIYERVWVDLRATPNALYFWALLQSLFDLIFRPFFSHPEHLKAWSRVHQEYKALCLPLNEAMLVKTLGQEANAKGESWSAFNSAKEAVDAAKESLLQALQGAASGTMAALFRAVVTQHLVEAYYYTDATRGAPTMPRVLTKPLERILSAFFGGDWLEFLRYIGERERPEELVSGALPEAKLYVTAEERVERVASKHAIPTSEIERMLTAFWGGERATSPVKQRVKVLGRYWRHFDEIHARQESGMQPLWGFVVEESYVRLAGVDHVRYGPAWYVPGCYRKLLPPELLEEIEALWGGMVLLARPGRIVTSIAPHALMAQTLGPALRFWHGTALTAWFVAEGPTSRTDMAGLATYHARDLAQISHLGHPVDRQLFADLIATENKLGKPVPTESGSRRDGFELLRDTITAHRRRWAEHHLEEYLRARWETEIRSAAREFNRLYELKGKEPSLRALGQPAQSAINHWFGGDVSAFYAAFGEKSPVLAKPIHGRLLPRDTQGFMSRVFDLLGGQRRNWNGRGLVGPDRAKHDAEWQAHGNRKSLAELSIWYVQLCEAIGWYPSLKEFGPSKFAYFAPTLANDTEQAWSIYSSAIQGVLAEMKDD